MAGRRQRPPESHFVTDFPQTRGRGGKIFLYANELWSMSKDSIHLSYSGLLDSSGIFPGVKADAEAFGIYANEVPVESATIDSVSIGRFHLISLLNRSPLPRWHWEEGGGGPGHRISGRLRDPPTGVADYLPISIELQVVEQQSHPPLAEWRLQRPQWAALLVSTFMQISRMQMRQFDSFLSLFIFFKDICTRTESGKLRTAPSSTSPNWSNCKWHLYANFMLILC